MLKSSNRRLWRGMLIGMAGIAIAIIIHLCDYDLPIERLALDFRFRYSKSLPPSDDILHIDIDDGSLESVGRWPWPREYLAGVIDTLEQCGAKVIALDIELVDHQPVRHIATGESIHEIDYVQKINEVDFAKEEFQPPILVFDDAILTESISKAPVILPVSIKINNDINRNSEKAYLDIERQTRQILQKNALVSIKEIQGKLRAQYPDQWSDEHDRVLRQTYLHQRSIQVMRRFTLDPGKVHGINMSKGTINPPLAPMAASASGIGCVTSRLDSDGIVRRIPMCFASGTEIYPQFALAIAVNVLGKEIDVITGDSSVQLVHRESREVIREIPIIENDAMLINWAPASNKDHIPIGTVAAIFQQKRAMAQNVDLVRASIASLPTGVRDQVIPFLEQDVIYFKKVESERNRYRACLYDPGKIPLRDDKIYTAGKGIEKRITTEIHEFKEEIEEMFLPADPSELDARDRDLYHRMVALHKIMTEVEQRNKEKQEYIEQHLNILRERIEGKICLIGSTSTAAHDLVATPLSRKTPGIVVHANILNTILNKSFLSKSPAWLNILVIALLGIIISFVTARRSLFIASAFAIFIAVVYIWFNVWIVFGVWRIYLNATSPLVAILATFMLVTIYRQLSDEKGRRQIKEMFSHSMSHALVNELLKDPSLCELGGHERKISCMFTDLAGFTDLSGELGPPATVKLLNRYFDVVTDVVQHRFGGYINKFLGDGVFAIFGAPMTQPDHSGLAINAAIEYLHEVETLNKALAEEMNSQSELKVRIGITTDIAMVGNCGSSDRMDYTAIGECVNMSARLEASNKFFGTSILVSNKVLSNCDSSMYLTRSLGNIHVKGISFEIPVSEVVALKTDATVEDNERVRHFEDAIDLVHQKEIAQAQERFKTILEQFPDDKPSKIYLDLCSQWISEKQKTTTTNGLVTISIPFTEKAGE